MIVIDCHCHAGKGDGLTGPWDTDAPLDAYLARARQAGIARTVVFPAFCSDYGAANERLAALIAAQPERLWGFVMLHPVRDAGRVGALVQRAVTRHGFRGIKVHKRDAALTREVCEVSRRWRIPVLYDIGGDVGGMELLASEYPDVAFIVPHLGSFDDDWRAQLGVIDLLCRYPNVHADSSGVRRFDLLVQAVQRAGPHKLLFGSDGPWLHPGLELAKIRALNLPLAAQCLVEGGNLLRLFRRRGAHSDIGTDHDADARNGLRAGWRHRGVS